jgi:hypothetical protein
METWQDFFGLIFTQLLCGKITLVDMLALALGFKIMGHLEKKKF